MSAHLRAGSMPKSTDIIDINYLTSAYYVPVPSKENLDERHKISFGTSGHRGRALDFSFNEEHILAITQAVCDIREKNCIRGKLFLGMDTHALSLPAFRTALEVLIANKVYVAVQQGEIGTQYTPTPVISHAIINANLHNDGDLCDGIIITPSHNPPSDGGFKYNPAHGGPADTNITKDIEIRANYLLSNANEEVKRVDFDEVLSSEYLIEHDYITEYVEDLEKAIDFECIKNSGIRIGVDPLSGSSVQYWKPIAERYEINIECISDSIDPTFRNIPLDHDGVIRMDCSSAYVMSSLLQNKDAFDISFANDPDADRHGIVTQKGLVPANHFLAVAADYLLQNRPLWKPLLDNGAQIGKTIVTSAMVDRVAQSHNSSIYEVPVGFKYFVQPLIDGKCVFACEESAGASFLCLDGTVWSTDKDGILLCLLSAEILAKTGKNPSQLYRELEIKHGKALNTRIDSPASPELKQAFKEFQNSQIPTISIANEMIMAIIRKTSGNNQSFGGFKIATTHSWFAARPSGTEDICKVYIETFLDEQVFEKLKEEAINIVNGLVK